jgi:hypothetical protein
VVVPPENAKPPPRRLFALPEGWVPNDRNLADARDRGFSEQEINREAAKFRDHHLARGTTFKDWDAAWRSARWSCRSRVRASPSPRRPIRRGPSGDRAGGCLRSRPRVSPGSAMQTASPRRLVDLQPREAERQAVSSVQRSGLMLQETATSYLRLEDLTWVGAYVVEGDLEAGRPR